MVLSILGCGAAIYCAMNYPLGEFNNLGPGMFPTGAGLALAIFGLAIAIPAFFRGGPAAEINLRAALAVLVAIGVFAATANTFGLAPAAMLAVLVSILGDTRLRVVGAIVLAVALSVVATLIFVVGLGVALPIYRWPF
jgi:hypothetical protein